MLRALPSVRMTTTPAAVPDLFGYPGATEDSMRTFMHHVVEDLHHGRESWRVIVITAIPALAITIAAQLLLP